MKIRFIVLLQALLLCNFINAQTDYARLVNPFIGSGGHGHTFPGASMPFGMMQLSPDTRLEGWDGCGGYHYSDNKIYGFSHTHLSGTGVPDYCDILLMPFTGQPEWENTKYASSFSHATEKASPGYYEVMLDKDHVKAQLSTSYRSGMHQYTFPAGTEVGGLLIDLKHRDQVLDAYIERVSDFEVKGYRRSKGWARDQVVYFYIRFEKPIDDMIISGGEKDDKSKPYADSGKDLKAALTFPLDASGVLRVKIGISAVSMDGAKANLDSEIPAWNFEAVHSAATSAWNKELSKIEVKGGTADQQTVFYTALYHTMLCPNIYMDVDGKYLGTDHKVHQSKDYTNYTVFSLWDTYRAFHPLMTIINQKRTSDWINTFLSEYKYGGMLPVWELSANETFCMIGYHSVPVIADAYQKGIRGFDTKLAMEAMRSYAESERFGLRYYANNGYLSNDHEHESVSKTMEYAYDDWCIAQFAKGIEDWDAYKLYMERAQYFKNLFDPSTLHMRGKIQGMWVSPFDPREVNNFFTEGNSWHYSFAAPQDIEGLIRLMGGKDKFVRQLDTLFYGSSQLTGRDQSDVTGLIGQYAQGNEPSHHMAYLYSFAGQPWKTEDLVHKICTEFYLNGPDGLIGNEDCGQMSAWYVLSAMGFYPVCPGMGQYVLGTPLFDAVTIHMENGNDFVIQSPHKGSNAYHLQSATLWHRPYTKLFLEHADIMKGGLLELSLGDKPNTTRGGNPDDLPYSAIRQDQIVPVPFFDMSTNKFKGKTMVKLKCIDADAKMFYRIMQPNIRSVFVPYTQPFEISAACQVDAYAKKGDKQSKTVSQQFIKISDDKSITVLSTVHPMYTAGGPDALIDGITGSTNWRTGEWQSYFDTDFEAIVDLKKPRQVSQAGIHVLQDVGAWIVYPKEVIISTSDDGKNFKELTTIKNTVKTEEGPVVAQELVAPLNIKTRYLRIRATNGGKLPAWHESAGSPSHIFIDEVIVH
jgi:predicted alpha-1,2-mannosidase